ncbi:hypothetical protein DPEC_G00223700 [Dallia pectoralis]|uniref:Uncharacterized protein n=1 Tax=Dallia pectoralis TaxID=75939 RepID=A0ACC2FZN6_DALPE|nr:hypothetical protein DPEC_G00223700 [Dallia pectoralis]
MTASHTLTTSGTLEHSRALCAGGQQWRTHKLQSRHNNSLSSCSTPPICNQLSRNLRLNQYQQSRRRLCIFDRTSSISALSSELRSLTVAPLRVPGLQGIGVRKQLMETQLTFISHTESAARPGVGGLGRGKPRVTQPFCKQLGRYSLRLVKKVKQADTRGLGVSPSAVLWKCAVSRTHNLHVCS